MNECEDIQGCQFCLVSGAELIPCDENGNEFNEVLNYTMANVLKDRFGFSDLNIVATYDYEEWFK